MDLTPFEWFQVAAAIGAFFAAAAVYLWGRDRAVAISEAISDERMKMVYHRLSEAGAVTSKLASYVQGLPTKADTDALWHVVNELRERDAQIRERVAAIERP